MHLKSLIESRKGSPLCAENLVSLRQQGRLVQLLRLADDGATLVWDSPFYRNFGRLVPEKSQCIDFAISRRWRVPGELRKLLTSSPGRIA